MSQNTNATWESDSNASIELCDDCRQAALAAALEIAEEEQKRCLDLLKSAPGFINCAKAALEDYEKSIKHLEQFDNLSEKPPIDSPPMTQRKSRASEKAISFLILDLLLRAIGAPMMDHAVLFVLYLIAVEFDC